MLINNIKPYDVCYILITENQEAKLPKCMTFGGTTVGRQIKTRYTSKEASPTGILSEGDIINNYLKLTVTAQDLIYKVSVPRKESRVNSTAAHHCLAIISI